MKHALICLASYGIFLSNTAFADAYITVLESENPELRFPLGIDRIELQYELDRQTGNLRDYAITYYQGDTEIFEDEIVRNLNVSKLHGAKREMPFFDFNYDSRQLRQWTVGKFEADQLDQPALITHDGKSFDLDGIVCVRMLAPDQKRRGRCSATWKQETRRLR